MPIALEKKLRAEAKKKRFGKERTERYVYGTLRKLGYPVGKGAKTLNKKLHKKR